MQKIIRIAEGILINAGCILFGYLFLYLFVTLFGSTYISIRVI